MELQIPAPKYLLVKLHVNAVRIVSALVSETWLRKKQQTFYPGHLGSDSTITKATRKHSAPDKSKWHSYSYELCATYDDFDVAQKKLLKSRKGESIESTDVDQKGKHHRKKFNISRFVSGAASKQLEEEKIPEDDDDSDSEDTSDSAEEESSSTSGSDEEDTPLAKAPKPPASVVLASQRMEISDPDDDSKIESDDNMTPVSPSVSVSKEPVGSEPIQGTSNDKNADLLPVQVLQNPDSALNNSLVLTTSSDDEQSEKSKEQSTEPLENNASKKAKSIMDQKAGGNPFNINGGSASRKRPYDSKAKSVKGTTNDKSLKTKDSSDDESEAEEIKKKKTKKKKSSVAESNGLPPGKKTEESGIILKGKSATANTSSCNLQSAPKKNSVESSDSEEFSNNGKEVALRNKATPPEKTSAATSSGSISQSAADALAKIVRQNRAFAKKQKLMNAQISGALAAPVAPRSWKAELGLPLYTMEAFENFNESLKQKINQDKFAHFIAGIGGNGARAAVVNAWHEILTPHVGKDMNREGRKTKKHHKVGLKRKRTYIFLRDTLKTSEKYRTELTDDLFSNATYDYLRHSKSRYVTFQKRLQEGVEANEEETY